MTDAWHGAAGVRAWAPPSSWFVEATDAASADSGRGALSGRFIGLLILAWLVVEVLFYIWYRIELRRAQAVNAPPHVSVEERNFVLDKMLLHAEDYGMWRQVQGWFLTKDRESMHSPHEIGTDDFRDLIAWAFFYKAAEDLDQEESVFADHVSRKIAGDFQLDQSLRPGRTGVVSVRHTLDTIHAIHRPLFFYAAIQLLYVLHGVLLRARGFRRGRHKGLWYWHRLSKDRRTSGPTGIEDGLEDEEPLAFFHGIGLGLVLYLPLLLRLQPYNQILFEMPWIAMNPFAYIPSSTEYASWVEEALRAHGVGSCTALGHSFGSLPVAWLIRQHPGRISRAVLVDPVAIFLNLPDVCVNFLYKYPRSAFGKMLRLFGAREFGIARTLMRHFFWTDSVLFPEMLPEGSSVILMGNDRVLPVKDIYTSAAKQPGLQTTVIEGLDHGHFLIWPSATQTILEHVAGGKAAQPGACKQS
mmetsp:Transcript_49029/g.151358  ORF Transcript_49029/g.151358 Transcript_49029/m.151358 type:complete len:470 (+) Transcript_49029:61-1470(+)